MMIWEIQRQMVQPGTKDDKEALIGWLAEGWEPFAVTWDGDAFDYHLRRQFDDAEVRHNDGSAASEVTFDPEGLTGVLMLEPAKVVRRAGRCATHNDLAWIYDDGSVGCYWAAITETGSMDCVGSEMPEEWVFPTALNDGSVDA